mmetsp:Transcript_19911/g.39877  ORF Transcript_19911/g.39877 Transcript_19911/m.39877 type:complete len:187 (+) Transcript_19911:69-629(+)
MAVTEVQRKVALLGWRAVGKSALTAAFVNGVFVEAYDPTIQNVFHKTIKLRHANFNTDIVDTAGMDEYSNISREASVGVHGYLLMFSIASASSFEKVKVINDKLLNLLGAEVPRVLVGTMCDLNSTREVSQAEGQALAEEWGVPFIECSAKTNTRVVDVFSVLLEEVEKDSGLLAPPEEEGGCLIL